MEKTYSKEEVRQLIDPLYKQIKFYQDQYIKCRRFIVLPWYKQIFNKWSFIKSLWKDDEESDTLIENLRIYSKKNPNEFGLLKEFYDRNHQKITNDK